MLRVLVSQPFLVLSVVAAATEAQGKHVLSKMKAAPVVAGLRLMPEIPGEEQLSTEMALFHGEDCSPGKDFTFPVSAGDGEGSVGIMDNTNPEIKISVRLLGDDSEGDIHLGEDKVPNFFSAIADEGGDSTAAMRLSFSGIPDVGAFAAISCSHETDLLVAYKDKLSVKIDLERTVTGPSPGRASSKKIREEFHIKNNGRASANLSGKALKTSESRASRARISDDVTFTEETDHSLVFEHNKAGEVLIIQVEAEENKRKAFRSAIVRTSEPPSKPAEVTVDRAAVTDEGDVEIYFGGIPVDQHLLIKARIAVQNVETQRKKNRDVIDTEAIVDDGRIVVHGGWIRAARSDVTVEENDDIDIVVRQAIVQDPENSYRVVGRLNQEVLAMIMNDKNIKLLNSDPSDEEIKVSEEMRNGRFPSKDFLKIAGEPGVIAGGDGNLRSRRLQFSDGSGYVGARILVHGYCASNGNPFPVNQFSYAVPFVDPATGSSVPSNWSHDLFARKIRDFANNQGIDGCSVIAHSQGGAAALHLYNYYWSCLDYSQYVLSSGSEGRLIQSVGTPYRGTALAGTLAALGSVFGAGCGTNNDLTESGADAWLTNIGSTARSRVYYHTTSFTDNWWSYDYCEFASDPFLSDPDDGVIERARGQLSGGNNKGHNTGWCHTTGMEEPAQYLDSGRNSDMNFHGSL